MIQNLLEVLFEEMPLAWSFRGYFQSLLYNWSAHHTSEMPRRKYRLYNLTSIFSTYFLLLSILWCRNHVIWNQLSKNYCWFINIQKLSLKLVVLWLCFLRCTDVTILFFIVLPMSLFTALIKMKTIGSVT